MRVLYVFNRGEIGGATKALMNVIKGINEEVEITVLTPVSGKVKRECEKLGIECHYIKYFEIGYAFNDIDLKKIIKFILLPILFILNLFGNKMALKKLESMIDISKYDVIHTNTNRDDFGILISKKYNIPHIMHLREFDKEFFNIIYLKKCIYKYFNNNTCCFISVSNSVKDNYINKGIDRKKIFTIYDGIDYNKIIYNNNELSNNLRIIMLSNICTNKGQIQLIDAISKLPIDIKKYIYVDLYGTGSNSYLNYLKKEISSHNLDKQFNFKGYCNNVYDIINQYDIGVTASINEGFGLVTIEYMLAGNIVIASKSGANLEIISDEITGYLYDNENSDDLANKIEKIYINKKKKKEICENARKKVLDTYTSDICNKKTILLYKKILKSKEDF